MNFSLGNKLTRLLKHLAEDAWFAYTAIILLQVKVMLWIWKYRDLTPGDASSYYKSVYTWLNADRVDIDWSPIYTLFLAGLHSLIDNSFWVSIVAQISIAMCASLLVLALLRRLLPKHIAWFIAAWWAVLPINFDTVYNVHLFSALFPMALFLIAAYFNSIQSRGVVLSGLLFSAVLVRNEYSALFVLWLFVTGGYELYLYRKQSRHYTLKEYLFAYCLPFVVVFLVIGAFYTKSGVKYPEISETFEEKQAINLCQVYAYNRIQQGDSWQGDIWTECQNIIERDFGRPAVTFFQAIFINPRPILEHFWWNIKLIPSGTQLALFSYYSGGPNPDYMPAKKSPAVWLWLLLVLGLSSFAATTSFIIKFFKKSQSKEHVFVWLLMCSAALLVLGLMVTQRPRPSYMFPYSLLIMALTGLGLSRLLPLMHINKVGKAWWPIAAVSLILFVPSYYNDNYINQFAYKGQGWRDTYEHIKPHIKRTPGKSPTVIVTPPGDYDILCNYLGATCHSLTQENNMSAEGINRLFFSDQEVSHAKNAYVLYLEDMIWKIESLSGPGESTPLNYVELQCFSNVDNVIACSDGTVDLNRGMMRDGTNDIPIRAALFVNDGYVVDQKNYRSEDGYYLQVLMKNNQTYMILVADERLFQTNFNQQYLLGNYDQRYFEEVYNDFPAVRILKFKRATGSDSGR